MSVLLKIENTDSCAVIPDDVYLRIGNYRYYLYGNGKGSIVRFTGSNNHKSAISLAQDVMQDRHNMYDHKDRDPFNNMPDNLRQSSYTQNARNRSKMKKACSSRFKGVALKKATKRWAAYICVNYEIIHLGYFDSEIEAAIAYNNAAIKFFGAFANLNVI